VRVEAASGALRAAERAPVPALEEPVAARPLVRGAGLESAASVRLKRQAVAERMVPERAWPSAPRRPRRGGPGS